VLDEPTNHLDLESRESLESALEAFPGTVLLVSHDRALLDAVADRLLAVEDGQIVSYPGGWADYARAQEGEAAPPPPKPKREKPSRAVKAGPSPLEAVETEVALAEERVNELERKLAADWGDVDLLAAHKQAREELARLITRWESLFEASGSTTQ
jgi:ATP-binding cassette subfamily F protein 3